jgi:uncharacterized phage infection (PIP) family protein YhgE
MKNLNEMVAGWEDGQPSSDLDKTVPSHPPEEAFTTKKLALLQKCDDLAEVTEHYADAYEAVLRALAVSNRQSIRTLQDQLFQLKASIPQLEKKFIKRIKLVGTLTDLHKQTQKIKLKPEMARKKDLNKIDDFLLSAYRTLNALNGKRTQR